MLTVSSAKNTLDKNYRIPKISEKEKRAPVRDDTPPQAKKQKVSTAHEMSDHESLLDYDEEIESDLDYDIDFEDDSTIEDRIEELLQSPPKATYVFTKDGKTPSSAPRAGTEKPEAAMTSRAADLELGEIPEEQLDPRLAQIAHDLSADDDVGPDVMTQLASIFTTLLSSRLSAERLKTKMDDYPQPANVPLLQPPRVNDTVWNTLDQASKDLDTRHKKIQLRLIRGLTALARMMEVVLQNKRGGTAPDLSLLLEKGMTAFALLANANYELSLRRRESMRSGLNPRFARLCFPSTPVTTDLFGDEVPRMVEDIQRSHKLERNLANRGRRGGYQNKGNRNYNNNNNNKNRNQYGQRGNGGNGNGRYNGGNNYNNNNNGSKPSTSGWSKNSKRGGGQKRQQ